MPELPEVETTRRLIEPDVLGRRVTGFEIGWQRTLGGVPEARLAELLQGKVCRGVERRAKYLLLGFGELEDEGVSAWLVVHLRMTGRLVVEASESEPSKHRRFSLRLSPVLTEPGSAAPPLPRALRSEAAQGKGGAAEPGSVSTGSVRLDFLDPRKFGRCVATDDPTEVMPALGPEPLGGEFTAAGLFEALRGRRRQLKPLLLDQSFLAGLGNIYVDESLFRARLHPLTSSERVSRAKAGALHAAIRKVLAEAIEREGSSFDGFYRTPTGQPGSYQHQFQVYGRHGKACRVCGATLRRIVVGQRGTHFCPGCQRRR